MRNQQYDDTGNVSTQCLRALPGVILSERQRVEESVLLRDGFLHALRLVEMTDLQVSYVILSE